MSNAVAQEVVAEVGEITEKKTSTGRTYWLIKAGSKTFKTWNQATSYTAKELFEKSKPAKIIFHEDIWQGREREMVDNMIDELVEAPAGSQPDKGMTNKDWNEKEDREHIRRLFNAHLIQMTQWWMSEAGKAEADSDDDRRGDLPSYQQIIGFARRAAVSDLDWIRNYATGEVPFEAEPKQEEAA